MPPRKRPTPIRPSGPAKDPIHPFDHANHVETSGLIPAAGLLTGHPHDQHVTAYYAVAPSILRALIDLWLTTRPSHSIEHVTFIDIGAGKGRGLFVAAEYPFRAVLGIELNPTLAALARQNLAAWLLHATPLAPITLIEGDATAFRFPPTPCLLFLFHPFEAPVLRKLLRRLEAHFAARPGTLDLLYVNSEHAPVLDRHPAFTRLFFGKIPMSPEDHAADLAAIANQTMYGSTGDEECALYRLTGRLSNQPPKL